MIVFDLECRNGHVFEGWFESGSSFEEQLQQGLVSCPVCEDIEIVRKLSNFGIKKGNRQHLPAASDGPTIPVTEAEVIRDRLSRKLYDFIEKNFDDVGCDFTKEALKIHYGVSEPRNIRGVSTLAEEKLLKEEGINVYKVPIPPEKSNTDAS
ncbi:MAG: DUF1178 family protein [Thermodesulfobacteriota bacterium]